MKKTETQFDYSRWPVIYTIASLALAVGLYFYRDSITPGLALERSQLLMKVNSLQSETSGLSAYTESRLAVAERSAANYRDLAIDEAKIDSMLGLKDGNWRVVDRNRESLGGGMMRYRVRLRWLDSVVADWLPVIVPYLREHDLMNQPIGLESLTIKTRGGEAQRSIDLIEIAITGICREKPISEEPAKPANADALKTPNSKEGNPT